MSTIRFSFLAKEYDELNPNRIFLAQRGALGFKYEEDKESLSIWCFPTDKRYVSVKEVKFKGRNTECDSERVDAFGWPDPEGSFKRCIIDADAKHTLDLEMSDDSWNAVKKMADSCEFNYEILG